MCHIRTTPQKLATDSRQSKSNRRQTTDDRQQTTDKVNLTDNDLTISKTTYSEFELIDKIVLKTCKLELKNV